MSTRKSKITVSELAKGLGISTRRIHQLQGLGMPTHSLESAQAWREARGNSDSAEELRRERIELVRAQRERIEVENRVRAAELVPAAQVEADTYRAVAVARQRFLRLPHELAPQLEGLGASRISKALHAAITEILEELANPASYA